MTEKKRRTDELSQGLRERAVRAARAFPAPKPIVDEDKRKELERVVAAQGWAPSW